MRSLKYKRRVGIIGGGIAGASVAAGLEIRGIRPHIIDSFGEFACASSGNRLALQLPRLSVDHNIASRMSADCLSYSARLSDEAKVVKSNKVISLDWPSREAMRQAKFRMQLWPDDLMHFVNSSKASQYAGLKLKIGGVVHRYGRVIDPVLFTHFLAGNSFTSFGFEVVEIRQKYDTFQVFASDGRCLSFDQLVLAGGADLEALNKLLLIKGIDIEVTSGQVSHVPETTDFAGLQAGMSFGGYFTPSKDGYHELGATFDRNAEEKILRSAHYHNKNLLPIELARLLPDPKEYGARVSRRASSQDRSPVVGKVGDNLFVLGALGARGLTLAPLLGDMLAAQMLAMPVTLGYIAQQSINPFRFRLRDSRC